MGEMHEDHSSTDNQPIMANTLTFFTFTSTLLKGVVISESHRFLVRVGWKVFWVRAAGKLLNRRKYWLLGSLGEKGRRVEFCWVPQFYWICLLALHLSSNVREIKSKINFKNVFKKTWIRSCKISIIKHAISFNLVSHLIEHWLTKFIEKKNE